MDWIKKTTLTLSMSLLMCVMLSGQSDLRKANKYIELQDFDSAISALKSITAADPNNQEAQLALAQAYQLNNQLTSAHTAYSKALALGEIPAASSGDYGKVLMGLKDYEGALNQFSLYGTEFQTESEKMIQKCVYAIEHSNDLPAFSVVEEFVNTSKRDFGPAFFGDEIVYLSNRSDMRKVTDLNPDVNIEVLKAAKDSKGILNYPKRIKSLTGQSFNIVSISYNPTLEMVAVTKGGQYDNINLTAEDKCTLYIGRFDRHGAIDDLKPYEFNQTDYSTGFASFSEDGMTMYFASDREGGHGGFDLYESKMVGGKWSAPINLGAEVNTSGNEITPTRAGDQLLFASDTRAGFGGFDLFRAYEGPAGFVNAENLGTGINSSFDEYGMIYDVYDEVGYITSTRSSGKGLEDLYRVKALDKMTVSTQEVVKQDSPIASSQSYEILKGMAVDQLSGEPIASVEVLATTDDETTIVKGKTNDKGMFSMPLIAGKYYSLKFETPAYLTSSRTIMMDVARKMPLMKIEMMADQIVAQADEPKIQPVALGKTSAPKKKPESTVVKSKVITKPSPEVVEVTTKETAPSSSRTVVSTTEAIAAPIYTAPSAPVAYAIQVAAVSKNEKAARFANIKDLGSLYTLFDSKVYKVRCGLFSTREEAAAILQRIKVRGYESAFIVEEKPTDSMDLVMMDFGSYESKVATSTTVETTRTITASTPTVERSAIASSYKVRLATYSNPKWFDGSKVEGKEYGYVEIYSNEKGQSIYLLAGFDSKSEADRAKSLAKSKGFKDAYVVLDENGILSKAE